ncbi:MAG: PrgI family protein [Eubacterium sp.]|nr:PrgI family protein [Eubacterium sp.]
MKIDINKDFEEAFPNEVYSGFTLGQCVAAVSGMILSFGAAFLLWRLLGIPIVECTYIAIPLMVPVCAIGFYKYQGQSLIGIIREFFYFRHTERLAYSAGEYRRNASRIFSAGRIPDKRPEKNRKDHRKSQKGDRRKKHMSRIKKEGTGYGNH